MMKLAERHYIRQSQESQELNDITHKSKNIYNRANYIVKQKYNNDGEYLNYHTIDKLMQKEDCYKSLPSKVSQQTLRILDRNWKAYFASKRAYFKNPSKFQKCPRPPKYLDKQGNFITIYSTQSINKGNKLSKTNITFTTTRKPVEVRIIPKKFGFILEVVYEKECKLKKDNKKFASIDLGLNNLATITSDQSKPILVNGRMLKSINQYFNKYPTKKNLKKRYFRIENYFHHASKFVIDYCKHYDIGKIIIGYNEGWKQKIKLGKKTNQNFCFLPFLKLINKIKYKAELEGIEVILTEESYTSKSSFFDSDPLKSSEFSGKRIKRGLYKTKDGFIVNADVNGSLNIGRKVIHNYRVDRSLVARPVKVNPLRTSFYKFL